MRSRINSLIIRIQCANCKTKTIQAVQKYKSWHVLCKIAIERDVKKSKKFIGILID